MENDLRDALIAWQGGELPPGRADALLEQLRSDREFRRAFAEEVWTLSLTRVAQAPDPRWLALQEELAANDSRDEPTREAALLSELRNEPIRFVDAWWRRLAVGSLAAAAGLALALVLWNAPRAKVEEAAATMAVLVQAQDARWEGRDLAPGSTLAAGKMRLLAGRANLLYPSGVELEIEGPASVELLTPDRVLCREGRVRTKVPPGAEGFCVETPAGTVTDLGTQISLSVSSTGKTQVVVLEGKAEVAVPIPGQDGVRTALLGVKDTAAFAPGSGEISSETETNLLESSKLRISALPIAPEYRETILSSSPLLYWRMDRESAGNIPNEVPGAPALRIAGGARISPDDSGRVSALFGGNAAPGAIYLDGTWTKPAKGHAIEFWFATESTDQMALAALTVADTYKNHIALVELPTRRPGRSAETGIVRYLSRWPASSGGGVNLYSSQKAFPYRWHHLVAQESDGNMELFINGESLGKAHAAQFAPEVRCALQFGCLEYLKDRQEFERPFAGRIAEVALYGRLLSPEEIRRHASLRQR